MSDNDTGAVRAYSDGNASRGVWVGGPSPAAAQTQATIAVEPIMQGRIEGADLDTFRGGEITSTLRDGSTGDIIRGRDPNDNDLVTITTNTGRKMEVRVRNAIAEGFLYRDQSGALQESDRAAQQAAFDELQRLEQSKRENEQVRYSDEVEQAVHEMAGAMSEAGLNFGDEFATYLGSDGSRVSDPASQWAEGHGLEMREEMSKYVWHMRRAVESEVLKPQGIEPESFLEFLQANRDAATRAAMRAHHGKSLDGFRQLARMYRDTGGMARQRRRG